MRTLLAAACCLALGSWARAESWDARLVEADGEVTVFTAQDSEGSPAAAGMPLENGDRIVTGAGGRAELAYDGEGAITLESGSELTVSALDRGGSEVTLALGALVAKFNALLAGRQFRVRTQTAVAAVRGTEFAVEVEGDQTHVGVFDEGRIAVADLQGREELVGANQELSVRAGEAPARAVALRRFARRRAALKALRRRHAGLRAAWKTMPPERRRELRRELRGRVEQRRENRRERGRNRRERRRDRRPNGGRP